MTARSRFGSWNIEGALMMAQDCVERQCRSVPVDIENLARLLGVLRVESADISIDGYLGRGSDGQLLIRYKSSSPRARSRFTIAHELGHLLLYRASDVEIPQCATRGRNRSTDEELAANRVASELLMPRRAMLSRLYDRKLSWALVRELAREFDVSLTAISRRIIEVSQQPTAIFWATVSDDDPAVVLSCRCRTSQAHCMLFSQPPLSEAQSIVNSLGLDEPYHPQVQVDGIGCLLQWDDMRVERFDGAQHWFLCWISARR